MGLEILSPSQHGPFIITMLELTWEIKPIYDPCGIYSPKSISWELCFVLGLDEKDIVLPSWNLQLMG